MKGLVLFLVSFAVMVNAISQNSRTFEKTPKDMVFVPQGSFVMKIIDDGDSLNRMVHLDAFWMSNEITNAEYKLFVNFLKKIQENNYVG
ncbi:MAG: hypothetical protein HC905_25890 [Bacteroidales bacterium]|nr:hypothetical protein [Bacteroidales bacterium]